MHVSPNNISEIKLSSAKAKHPLETIRSFSKHFKNVFLGHFNIKPLRNRIEALNEMTKKPFEFFLVNESKLDSSFSDKQFSIPG